MKRPGVMEAIFAPHIGKYVREVAGQLAHEMVVGGYSRRAGERRLTGEFIVYERNENGQNYYLTLGSHGEYDAIRARIDAYRKFDEVLRGLE
jgi:hypothetical protein